MASLPNPDGLTVRARRDDGTNGRAPTRRRPASRAAPGSPAAGPRAGARPPPALPRRRARRGGGRQDGARRALGRRTAAGDLRADAGRRTGRERCFCGYHRSAPAAADARRLVLGPRRRRGRDAADGRQRRGRLPCSRWPTASPSRGRRWPPAASTGAKGPWSSSGRTATAKRDATRTPWRGATPPCSCATGAGVDRASRARLLDALGVKDSTSYRPRTRGFRERGAPTPHERFLHGGRGVPCSIW